MSAMEAIICCKYSSREATVKVAVGAYWRAGLEVDALRSTSIKSPDGRGTSSSPSGLAASSTVCGMPIRLEYPRGRKVAGNFLE